MGGRGVEGSEPISKLIFLAHAECPICSHMQEY